MPRKRRKLNRFSAMRRGISRSIETWQARVAGKLHDQARYIRLTYSAIALSFAVGTSSFLEKASDRLPAGYAATFRNALELYNYFVWGFVALFAIQFVWLLVSIIWGKEEAPPPPADGDEIHFVCRPSSPEIGNMTAAAEKKFDNDTMRREVVEAAQANGCAIGISVWDSKGRKIGFLDFYHVKETTLKNWIDGEVFERDLAISDFEPIVAAGTKPRLKLFVGALMLTSPSQLTNYYLAPLVVSAAKVHLKSILGKFDKVDVYASIFSKAGQRYAELEGMKLYRRKQDRGQAGDQYDVYSFDFDPNDVDIKFTAMAPHNTYVLQFLPE